MANWRAMRSPSGKKHLPQPRYVSIDRLPREQLRASIDDFDAHVKRMSFT
jgi:hypothetical protein